MRALSRVFSSSNWATLSFKPGFFGFGCFIWFLRRSEQRAIPPARRAKLVLLFAGELLGVLFGHCLFDPGGADIRLDSPNVCEYPSPT
jgi:hypothetical protein